MLFSQGRYRLPLVANFEVPKRAAKTMAGWAGRSHHMAIAWPPYFLQNTYVCTSLVDHQEIDYLHIR